MSEENDKHEPGIIYVRKPVEEKIPEHAPGEIYEKIEKNQLNVNDRAKELKKTEFIDSDKSKTGGY